MTDEPLAAEMDRAENAALLEGLNLIVASNRGPVNFQRGEDGGLTWQRSGGGLVTALLGLAHSTEMTWVASALNELEREWHAGDLQLSPGDPPLHLSLVESDAQTYDGYYNVIANPLLWFLQHSMWDFVTGPTITRETWEAWNHGYVEVNRLFAEELARRVRASRQPSLVMLQDYHLYLAPRQLRNLLRRRSDYTLSHFIHIPWPGPEDWGILPPGMRTAILEGLTAVDLLGFQTRDDGLNFIRTVESFLPGAHVSFKKGRVWYRNHATYVADFPISLDVQALLRLAATDEVTQYRQQISEELGEMQLIVRVDRTDPSKNIVRGFKAFEEMLQNHPEHCGRVRFYALLVPSRLEVEEYQNYHDDLTAAAGWINSRYGSGDWEPVRVLIGDNYPRAIAALQLYDALLVNSVADGMNLVAKEGPLVNQRDGVVVLSERTGARQQLAPGAMVISPCDIYSTGEALHQALTISAQERQMRAAQLRQIIVENDINAWLRDQLQRVRQIRQRAQA
jgi:trehalose 6-phosphate synthase